MTTTTWGFFPVSLSCTYSGDLFLMKLFYSSSAGEHIEHTEGAFEPLTFFISSRYYYALYFFFHL